MFEWIRSNPQIVWWLAGLSLVTFVGSLVAIPVLIVRMPADYFLPVKDREITFRARHPVITLLVLLAKNVFGVAFLLAGLAMLLLPGQGVLTMLIGISLMNFPGKRRLEIAIIRIPAVHRAIDWIRRKRHKPPLLIPPRAREAT